MRLAARLTGGLLILATLGFAVVAVGALVSHTWLVAAVVLPVGALLALAGRYFLRMNVEPDGALADPSPTALEAFAQRHLKSLRAVAYVGLIFSLLRLVLVSLHTGPNLRFTRLPLFVVALALLLAQTGKSRQNAFPTAASILGAALIFAAWKWPASEIPGAAITLLAYALAAWPGPASSPGGIPP